MENKYYTPDIEDIRVGYECEVESNHKWKHITLTAIDSEENHISSDNGSYWYTGQNLRTSYLTKEQLEAEGWEHVGGQLLSVGRQEFTKTIIYIDGVKRELELDYTFTSKILNIYYDCGEIVPIGLFNGYCPSINEFKYIIKLLQIK